MVPGHMNIDKWNTGPEIGFKEQCVGMLAIIAGIFALGCVLVTVARLF